MGFWEILILGILIYGIYKWGDKMAENHMKQCDERRAFYRENNSRRFGE